MTKILMSLIILLGVACGRESLNESTNSESKDEATGVSLTLLGDSISTGVLASTELGTYPGNKLWKKFNDYIGGGKFNAEKFQEEFSEPEHAAVSTTEAWGLPAYVASKHNIDVSKVEIFSSLKFGGRLMHVPGSLKSLKASYKSDRDGKSTDYVFMMYGANDLCAAKSKADFAKEFKTAINLVTEMHPTSTVVVAKVLPVHDILKFKYKYKAKVLGNTVAAVSCDTFRKRYCKEIFKEDVPERIAAYNEIISEEMAEAAKNFSGQLKTADEVAEIELTEKDVAFDCFHPSLHGQQKIAEAITKW